MIYPEWLRLYRKLYFFACFFTLTTSLIGCGILKKKDSSTLNDDSVIATPQIKKQLSKEEATEVMEEVGENWLYGHGSGRTVLNIAGIVLFPPYALYLLGNGLLSVAGYQPLYLSDMLAPETKEAYVEVYNEVTAVPGRVAAEVAEKEFREPDEIRARFQKFSVNKE
jgi:hypothetical protein